MKIAEMIKNDTSVTKVSSKFRISRQAMYNYMRFFDDEKFEKIPPEILDYFNEIRLANNDVDDSVLVNSIDHRLTELSEKIKHVDDELFKMKEQKQQLSNRIFGKFGKDALPLNCEERKVDEFDYENLISKINEESVNLERMKIDYDTLQKQRASMKSHIGRRMIDLKLRSRDFNAYSYYDGTKCMVISDCERVEDDDMILSLYAKLNGKYLYIKSYKQKRNEYYFLIDDLVFSAPLYYEIEKVCDYGEHDWEYEIIASSGMQKLIIENKENERRM